MFIQEVFDDVEFKGFITKDVFVYLRSVSRPYNTFGSLIFFVQTLGLVAKDTAALFSVAAFLNLDPESSTNSCMGSLSYTQKVISKIVIQPLLMYACIPLAIPVWNMIRSALLRPSIAPNMSTAHDMMVYF